MYDLTGRRKRFDLLAQEPEVGDTEAPALPPPLAAKAAALASLENGTEDLQVVAPSPRKPLVHREAPPVNAPPVKTETPAGVRDAEMEAAKELDADAYSKFLFETATRQLIGGLTLTKPEATISQRSAGAVKGLVDKRAKAKADALKAMELGMKASDYERQATKDADAKARDERDFAWRAKEKDEDQAGSAESRRLQAETNRIALGFKGRAEQRDIDKVDREKAKDEAEKAAQPTKTATELRKEFNQLSDVKTFAEVDTQYQKVKGAASNPSAAGDLSAIFAYMKMLDPGSSVREGEFANAQNAGGIDTKITAAYNNVLNGQRLTPEQRADFIAQAQNLYAVHRKRYDDKAKQYSDLATRSGARAEDVVGGAAPVAPAAQAGTVTLLDDKGEELDVSADKVAAVLKQHPNWKRK